MAQTWMRTPETTEEFEVPMLDAGNPLNGHHGDGACYCNPTLFVTPLNNYILIHANELEDDPSLPDKLVEMVDGGRLAAMLESWDDDDN